MDHRTPNTALYGLPFRISDFHQMPYRNLGSTGLKVSNVGLGTWKMGYPETGDGSRTNEKASLEILDAAWENGVTFWDTANRYNSSSGNSERIIGTWFANNPEKRRDIVLCTKLCGNMDGMTPNHGGLSRSNIFESVYASLERMDIDCIDVLYFHQFDNDTDPEESLMAVEDLIRQDLVRYFAVSNFSTEQLARYEAAMKAVSPRCKITAVQNRFDVLTGEDYEESVLAYCAKEKKSFVAWSPLGSGLLSERYLAQAGKGDRLFDESSLGKITPEVREKLLALHEVAKENEISISQLAIAYMLTLDGMGPVISACSSVEQLQANAAAGKITLSPKTCAKIREITGY